MENRTITRRGIMLAGLLLSIVFCMPAHSVFAAENLQAPQITVSGIVTDDAGDPIQGASVVVNGTTTGTITDADGTYILRTPADATLTVSFLGSKSAEVPVAGRESIPPVKLLLQEGIQMEQVVVTALGVRRDEKALGYAAQNVDGSALQTVKGVNTATSLTGKVSGLVVKNSTEFNTPPTLEMRGETPLLVINGVPYTNMTLRDVPADDIESISMLKGATAAALYGMRGSGGAVMVTTKGGSKRGLSVEINSNTMVTAGYTAIPEAQSSYGRGLSGVLGNDYTWGPKLDIGNTATQWNPQTKQMEDNMPLLSKGKNNLKNFMNTGVVTNNSVSVTQTGEMGFFRVSANHVYNKGNFPNQKLNITNFSVAGRVEAKKFVLDAQMGYGRTTAPQMYGYGYNNQGYIYQLVMWTGPEYDIRDYKDYWVTPNEKQNWHYSAWYDNPYLIAYEKLHSIDYNKLNASLNASYEFFPTLTLTFRAGYDYYKDEDTVRNPAGIYSTRGPTVQRLTSGGWDFSGKGLYGMNENWGNSINTDLMLNYNESFGKFDIDILGGGTIYYYQQRELGARTVNGLSVPGWYSLANAVASTTAGQDAIKTNYGTKKRQVNSIYAKASLSWNSAVFLDITGRNDWSSTQPENEMSYFYPSVATSVVLTEFFNAPKWLSMWKVRGSWTIAKTPLGVYDNNVAYSVGNSWGLTSATLPDNIIGSSNLKPSTSRTWEAGTAAYFFGRRLHVDFAYFAKLFYNRQISQTIAQSSSYKTTLINTDETYARRGFELTLSGYPVKNNSFEWSSMINLSSYHSYYVDIDPVYSADNQWVQPGKRVDYYASTEQIMTDPDGNWIHRPDGRVQLDTYQRLFGYKDPSLTFGFVNNFKLNNWTLGISIDGRIGGLMDNYIYGKMYDTGSAPETDTWDRYNEVVNGVKYIGKGVKVVNGSITYDAKGNVTSDTREYAANDIEVSYQTYMRNFGNSWHNRIHNASFIKLRELSIGYDVPKQWLGRSGISNLSFALTGYNLLLWTKDFKYSDPDVGKEDMNAPSQRMIGVNIKIGF